MNVHWFLLYVFLQVSLISAQIDHCHCANGTAGDCSCYCHLENSLLSSDGNRENLTRGFFPIDSIPTEFVMIKYKYDGKSTSKIWYWGARASYFVQPFEIFQYTSLFFGGSTLNLRTCALELTLAPECELLEPGNENMKTLTLRLKLYAESPSSTRKIKVTDSYYAKACDETIFVSAIEGNSRQLLIITICTSIATTVIATLIIVIMALLIGCTDRGSKEKRTNSYTFMESKCIEKLERHNPAIFALTIVSVFANIYMFCLSLTATSTWEQHHVSALISDLINVDEINYINRSSIGFLVVFNTITMCCSIIVIGIVAAFICFKDSKNLKNREILKNIRILRLVSVLCACLSICAHLPYIAIAYLNNEYHATGIFIYYSLLGCLLFGLSWITFHYYYRNSKDSNGDKVDTDSTSGGDIFLQSLKDYCKHKFLIIVALFLIISLTLIFFVILTCFFLMIPINKSISEFPNRIIGIYMSGGFVISTFLLYKLFVYLCRKSKHHQSGDTSKEESDGLAVVRANTTKLKELWRDRTDSERKCEEYIALKRIEKKLQNLATSTQSTGAQDDPITKLNSEKNCTTSS